MAQPLAAATATVAGSLGTPQLVGTAVAWTATYSGTQSAGVTFRWSVAAAGGMPRTVRDYSPASTFTYTPLNEGSYTVTVDVRDASGNPIATGSTTYSATSLLGSSSSPAVTATSNPLVAIYSTVCKAGKVRVHFALANQSVASGMTTPYYECQGARSTNILIAGMRANMAYVMQEEVDAGRGHQTGSPVTFQTGSLPSSLNVPPLAEITGTPSAPEPVMLISMTEAFAPEVQLPAAYDLAGNLIWFYSDPDTGFFNFFREFPGGTFIGTYDNDSKILREVDLLGNLVNETNTTRVSEELQGLGYPAIVNFNHDAYRLPNGYTAVLAQCLQFADQGSGPIPVLGDEIVVMDANWQVAWVWNPFDKLDTTRKATLGDSCTAGFAGCPNVPYQAVADWTHANALTYTANDGNILISLRSQDWVLKIDYRDGLGSGDVIWRLGPNGDFTANSSDPYPWFTHQHDPTLRSDGTLTVYDNGNTRVKAQGGNSRGQAWKIDEVNKTATLNFNADLGHFSMALGSARYLSNGNLHFESGFLFNAGEDDSVEVDATGQAIYKMAFYNAAYRSFRLFDLYSPN